MDGEHFYDIHTHIIPKVDDGSKSIEESLAMLRLAYDQGIRTIVTTPHFIVGRSCPKEKLLERFALLQKEAKKISEELTLYTGNELYYSSGIIEELQAANALTLADSRYVLVEFSIAETFRNLKEGVQELMMSGYRPILAHVERYQCMQDIENVKELVDAGCYIQVNASSFLGGFMDKRARYCKKLICQGCVHLIGSDCHNFEDRKPIMEKTYQYLRKYVDEKHLKEIFFDNPAKIIDNQYI